jgi:hypothetical protein
MPIAKIQLPDGRIAKFEVPEGTTPEQVMEFAGQHFGQQSPDPTANMGAFERFREGAAVGVSDLIRGGKQLLNIGDQDTLRTEIAAARELDRPYLQNTAGKIGNIASKVAASVPTMFIPGAGTIAGGAAIGAGLGLLEPTVSDQEAVENTLSGAAGGGIGVAAGRAIPALYNGLVRPFFKGGQRHIVGNTLREAIDNNLDEVLPKLTNPEIYVPGSMPTAAEATMLPKVAKLQKAARNLPDGGLLVDREVGNNAGRLKAIRGIAQDESARQAAIDARKLVTEYLYDKAGKQIVSADDVLDGLLIRPSAKQAANRAAKLAQERGETFQLSQASPERTIPTGLLDARGASIDRTIPAEPATYSGKSLHYVKMGLDDLLDSPEQLGIGNHERGAITSTKAGLLNWLDANIPDYAQARRSYESLSRPINQMDIGTALKNKLTPALTENGIPTRERANMFAEAIRNENALIQKTTGFRNKTLEDVMEPEQMATINGILKDLERKANAGDLAAAKGSDTAQNLIADNFLRSLLGPVGMPRSWTGKIASSAITNALPRRAVDLVAPSIEKEVQGLLVEAMSDPRIAAELIRSTQTPTGVLFNQAYQALPAFGAYGLLNAN